MDKIAQFEKVSFEQFSADLPDGQDPVRCYESIALPKRATTGSAGYDIIAPIDFQLAPGQSIIVPSGLRCRISEGWLLLLAPKSGLGIRFRLQLDNTVGIVDSDYYHAKNEGHILVAVTNDSRSGKTLEIPQGKAFVQAVFLPYGITEDDEAEGQRTGGFGSTNV